jgi:hypothetical protein
LVNDVSTAPEYRNITKTTATLLAIWGSEWDVAPSISAIQGGWTSG